MVVIFIAVRLPGINSPLHQDEYKWPIIMNPESGTTMIIPHPPLSQFIYQNAGAIVGYDVHFRLVPLFFGSINLILLFCFVRMLFGLREAVVASVIWIFSYFSVLASLMVDTDGQIMPFFFLIALISYHKVLNSIGRKRLLWAVILALSLVCGFLIKLSFIIAIAAILADFLWSHRHKVNGREVIRYGAYILGGAVSLFIVLLLTQFIFPFFNLKASLAYWEHFIVFDRNWFQTIIQCIKAILYASPFLILIPFLGKKEYFSKLKALIFFLIFAFIFYIIIFDFSFGALDRYLQLIILPLTIMSSIVVVREVGEYDTRNRKFLFLGLILSLVFLCLQLLPHWVPPLHPKSEWISRILSLRWNFVYPFSGGSGPLGFYVSFLFMGVVWITSILLLLWGKFKPQFKKLALVVLIVIGFFYNAVFTEEYLFGRLNGSAPRLLTEATTFMKDNPNIKFVTVYNDNGGAEIQAIGKYRKRLYTDPRFDLDEKIASLNMYKEHYFVLDVPRVDPTSIYQKYFDSCVSIYNKVDQKMSATVYDCGEAPDVKI